MEISKKAGRAGLPVGQKPAIRFLVESALKSVANGKAGSEPRSRDEWVTHLGESLMSESESAHKATLASLMATGVSSEEVLHSFVPEVSRYLGELWVSDKASFVDVTVGAGRLQKLYRSYGADPAAAWLDRMIPLGQSVMMVIPKFENHSLGGFVAADSLRRHGLWVHMAIALEREELRESLARKRFSMVGITLATQNSVEHATELVDFLRASMDYVPPIVIGGRACEEVSEVERRTGADFSAKSAREAIEKCGLSTVAASQGFTEVC
ncbi:hypothetical protein R5H30_15475 [Sulfitobacter sp. D35]|uniref:hypothetical protein n=1 Tax=Sulfitobacter sp. D35 TaxID=3083252 RepID=UPI00296F525E|nr:hypothetical protein [Sulfitobacter sp. D35]MDW4499394.1 hypothetical protein [Sulfitobacter sp. D35]